MLVDQRRWKDAEPPALRIFAIQDSLAGHAGPGDGGAARRDLRRDGAQGAGGAVSGTGGTGAVTINARLARTRAMTRTGQEAAMSTFTRPVLLVVLAAACSSQGGRPSHEAPPAGTGAERLYQDAPAVWFEEIVQHPAGHLGWAAGALHHPVQWTHSPDRPSRWVNRIRKGTEWSPRHRCRGDQGRGRTGPARHQRRSGSAGTANRTARRPRSRSQQTRGG